MDGFPKTRGGLTLATAASPDKVLKPSREQAMEAVRTLLAWAGDDPAREGLIETPRRVVEAFEEWFQGYDEDPNALLSKTFEDVEGYDDIVMLRDIEVESHCEHHMAPFLGKAYVAYVPTDRVVGISKLARVVEVFAKRLQNQETLTRQVAQAIEAGLQPKGVVFTRPPADEHGTKLASFLDCEGSQVSVSG